MKKLVLLFGILLMAFQAGNAQDATSRTANVGIKGGYNLAAVSLDDDDNADTGNRSGFHIGVYGESFLNQNISLQLELLYSQQGYEIEANGGTFTQKLDYINLPLMLKGYLADSFFLEVGPQIGVAISHKEEFDSNFNLFDTSQEFEPNSFDYGVNFGAGFKTDTGISFSARYHLGLGDIYDDGSPKNRVWLFSVGFDL